MRWDVYIQGNFRYKNEGLKKKLEAVLKHGKIGYKLGAAGELRALHAATKGTVESH